MKESGKFVLLALLAIAAPAFPATADLTVFDDSIENNFSFCLNVAGEITYDYETVHSGTVALVVPNKEFYGLDFCNAVSFSMTDYDGVSFWINGGASGGESMRVVVESSSTQDALYADIASLNGGPLPPNQWVHVEALFSDPLFIKVAGDGSTGKFNELIFVVESGGSGTFYFDDFTLKANDIFKNGFESCNPLLPTC